MKTHTDLISYVQSLLSRAEEEIEKLSAVNLPDDFEERIKSLSRKHSSVEVRLKQEKIKVLNIFGRLARAVGIDSVTFREREAEWILLTREHQGSDLVIFVYLYKQTPVLLPCERIIEENLFFRSCEVLTAAITKRIDEESQASSTHDAYMKRISETLRDILTQIE